MLIAQLPFFPAVKKSYDIEEMEPNANVLVSIYPEIARCVACNTCTKSCPQDLEVMDYIQSALRGDIQKTAELSFDCIMCGLCAARCPAEIVHYNVGILARRLYGKYMSPKSPHLEGRLEECEKGVYHEEIDKMIGLSKEELKKLYTERKLDFKIT